MKSKKEASSILKQIKSGKDFDKLAKKHSIDPSGKNGGTLGWVSKGQLVKPFETAAFKIKKNGSLSKVVKTEFGYHVIKRVDKQTREKLEFEKVKNDIYSVLYNQKKQSLTNDVLTSLKETYKIERHADKL